MKINMKIRIYLIILNNFISIAYLLLSAYLSFKSLQIYC